MHLPRQATIILAGKPPYLFPRPFSWESGYGGWIVGESYALVCPICLNVWAKCHMEGDDDFRIFSQHCEAHPGGEGVPGSLFPLTRGTATFRDEGLFLNLPVELLHRELLLHISHFERSLNESHR